MSSFNSLSFAEAGALTSSSFAWAAASFVSYAALASALRSSGAASNFAGEGAAVGVFLAESSGVVAGFEPLMAKTTLVVAMVEIKAIINLLFLFIFYVSLKEWSQIDSLYFSQIQQKMTNCCKIMSICFL
ncbi:MAG: hypothetical protein ACRCUQ_02085 [Alphaproteobacteria bacterium]